MNADKSPTVNVGTPGHCDHRSPAKPQFRLKPLVVAMRRVWQQERMLRRLEAQQRETKETDGNASRGSLGR